MDLFKTYEDYMDQVCEHFPTIDRKDIDKILRHGFKMFHYSHWWGMDTLNKTDYFTAYTGNLYNDELKYYHYWRQKRKRKLRYLYKREKHIYDGYYYFGLTQKEFEYWQQQTKKHKHGHRRSIIHFNYIYAYKIMEEAFVDRGRKYFFKFSYPVDAGWTIFKEDIKTRNAKYFAYRDENFKIQMLENNGNKAGVK